MAKITKKEIAENFVNGNFKDMWAGLNQKGPTGERFLSEAVARAFDVYQYLRGQYGASVALSFSNHLQKESDL